MSGCQQPVVDAKYSQLEPDVLAFYELISPYLTVYDTHGAARLIPVQVLFTAAAWLGLSLPGTATAVVRKLVTAATRTHEAVMKPKQTATARTVARQVKPAEGNQSVGQLMAAAVAMTMKAWGTGATQGTGLLRAMHHHVSKLAEQDSPRT